MRKFLVVGIIGFLFLGLGLSAQETETVIVGRIAIGKKAYHYSEFLQNRGRWIFPDFGYVDFNKANEYREFFIGAGATVISTKKLLIKEEGYLTQDTGPAAKGALYLWPWTYANAQLAPRVNWETAYFPYIPLKKGGKLQEVIERSKLERDFKHFKVGIGYSGHQTTKCDWEHKPFLSTTMKTTRLGNFEFWFQRVPGNHLQGQVRYVKKF